MAQFPQEQASKESFRLVNVNQTGIVTFCLSLLSFTTFTDDTAVAKDDNFHKRWSMLLFLAYLLKLVQLLGTP